MRVRERLLGLLWATYALIYEQLTLLLPYQQMVGQLIDGLRPSVTDGTTVAPEAVLDVGCGPGLLLREILDRRLPYQLTGIDSSPNMLARARRSCGGAVRFVRVNLDDALAPQGLAGPYAGFTLGHVLYTLKNPASTLAQLAQIASPGAVLVATTPLPAANPFALLKAHRAMARREGLPIRAARTFLPFAGLILMNLLIVAIFGRSGHLATEAEARAWFEGTGWELQEISRTYAEQDWFIRAIRVHERPEVAAA